MHTRVDNNSMEQFRVIVITLPNIGDQCITACSSYQLSIHRYIEYIWRDYKAVY